MHSDKTGAMTSKTNAVSRSHSVLSNQGVQKPKYNNRYRSNTNSQSVIFSSASPTPYHSPASTTLYQTQAATKSKDSNIRRALPARVVCNNMLVINDFSPKVTANDVAMVISYFSHYAMTPDGLVKSSLIVNLIGTIHTYGLNSTVVGCIAWLSNKEVLAALRKCRRVLLIVNHERYEVWGGGGMLKEYSSLPKFDEPLSVAFGHLNTVLSALEVDRKSGASKYASVRAFGNASTGPGTGMGRGSGGLEHCKYLVFFESQCYTPQPTNDSGNQTPVYKYKEVPCAVWTGSMNMTKASETHHENAVFIKSRATAAAYFHDFAATFMSSVPVSSKQSSNTPQAQLTKSGKFHTPK